MDPVGTVRQESHEDGGHSIWIRQDPGYPDNQFMRTEWTCIWSTVPCNIGDRCGNEVTKDSTVIGQVPGTPAAEGE
jgi:hypothetical protein